MQRNGVLSLNFGPVKQNIPFVIFTLIFIIGIFVGCLSVSSSENLTNQYSGFLNEFIDIRKDFNFIDVFKSAFLMSFPLYFAVFLCGTSLIGCAITPFVISLKGFVFGCLSGYLYSTYKLNGIVFNALILIPPTLICIFGLILISVESFSFSYLLSGICIKTNQPINIYSNFKTYCIKCLLFSIFALISVFVDMGMSAMFIKFFEF